MLTDRDDSVRESLTFDSVGVLDQLSENLAVGLRLLRIARQQVGMLCTRQPEFSPSEVRHMWRAAAQMQDAIAMLEIADSNLRLTVLATTAGERAVAHMVLAHKDAPA